MGRAPCCEKVGLKKGPWTSQEDLLLINYISEHGHGSWKALPKKAGLLRCGKSCRLRWTNYLRPDIKRGDFSPAEEQTIIHLHALIGNRWSAIASQLPKRTDNEIKNYWNTHLKKRLSKLGMTKAGILSSPSDSSSEAADDIGALRHKAQWESARLEAEARLSTEAKLRAEGLWASPPACTVPEHNRKTGSNWAEMARLMQNWEKSLQERPDLMWVQLWKSTTAKSSLIEDVSEKSLCLSGRQQLDATASCTTTSTSASSKLDQWPFLSAQTQRQRVTEAVSSSLAENDAIDCVSGFDAKSGNTLVGLPVLQDVDLAVLPCTDTTCMLGNAQLPSLKEKCEMQYMVVPHDELSDVTANDNWDNTGPNPVNGESSLLSSTAQSFSALLNDDFADDWSSMWKGDVDD